MVGHTVQLSVIVTDSEIITVKREWLFLANGFEDFFPYIFASLLFTFVEAVD